MRPFAYHSPKADQLVQETIRAIGAEVDSLSIPGLMGVVLGGGYGRGEGGVVETDDDGVKLFNDLDFFVMAVSEATAADIARIGEALKPISQKWTRKLDIEVDFSPAKPLWRLKHDRTV